MVMVAKSYCNLIDRKTDQLVAFACLRVQRYVYTYQTTKNYRSHTHNRTNTPVEIYVLRILVYAVINHNHITNHTVRANEKRSEKEMESERVCIPIQFMKRPQEYCEIELNNLTRESFILNGSYDLRFYFLIVVFYTSVLFSDIFQLTLLCHQKSVHRQN